MPVLQLGHDEDRRARGEHKLPEGREPAPLAQGEPQDSVSATRARWDPCARSVPARQCQPRRACAVVATEEVERMQRTPWRKAGTRPQRWPSSRRSQKAQRRPSSSTRTRLSIRAAAHTAGVALLAPVEGRGIIVCAVGECAPQKSLEGASWHGYSGNQANLWSPELHCVTYKIAA